MARDADDSAARPPGPPAEQRLDKWLWFARVVKSRSLAQQLVSDGRVKVNRERTDRPSLLVKVGDVVTFMLRDHVRVLKVVGTGLRRGPASEARLLYEDLSPPQTPPVVGAAPVAHRDRGSGRPTKKDRRAIDDLTGKGGAS